MYANSCPLPVRSRLLRLPVTVPNCNNTGLATNAAATPNKAAPANGINNDLDIACYKRREKQILMMKYV